MNSQVVGGEGEDKEVWSQLQQLQTENEQLRTSLEKEGGKEKVQEQMTCILHVIDNAVKTGHLKVGHVLFLHVHVTPAMCF